MPRKVSTPSNSGKPDTACPALATRSRKPVLLGLHECQTPAATRRVAAPPSDMAEEPQQQQGGVRNGHACPPYHVVFDGYTNKEGDKFMEDFEHYKCSPTERVNLLPLSLSKLARDWYKSFIPRADDSPFPTQEELWDTLREQFRARFRPSAEYALLGERTLTNRPQLAKEPVSKYIDTMHLAAQYCPEVTEGQLVRMIISGLRPEVRSVIMLQHPTSLTDLYSAASNCSYTDTGDVRQPTVASSVARAQATDTVGWLSGGFTPCQHLRPSSGREHTIVTYSVRCHCQRDKHVISQAHPHWKP